MSSNSSNRPNLLSGMTRFTWPPPTIAKMLKIMDSLITSAQQTSTASSRPLTPELLSMPMRSVLNKACLEVITELLMPLRQLFFYRPFLSPMAVGWDSAPLGKMYWGSALAKGTPQIRLVNVHYSSIYQFP